MALITMCCNDTIENGRTKYTHKTLDSLSETVDWSHNELIVVDNDSCEDTKEILDYWKVNCPDGKNPLISKLITLPGNAGTAKAINQAWKFRKPNQHLIKIDNDVEINGYGWVEDLEEAVSFDPTIGQIGLKRKDLLENPFRTDQYKSTLRMLPHKHGDRWVIVEDVEGVMGTCVLHNWRLIDKIGGLMQPTQYGFDDTIMSIRTKLAGFKCCFLPHIEIDHIDEGNTEYTEWKRKHAGEQMAAFHKMKEGLINGTIQIKLEI